jgi:hypothetical protein
MATENLGGERALANITLHDVQHVARALRRLNEIQAAPVLSAEDRAQVADAKNLCWRVVGSAAEALVALMDAVAGDPDVEPNGDELDGSNAEDEEGNFHLSHTSGLGCPISDPGEYATPEGVRQGEFKQSLPNEDAEEDNEDCDGFENEPLFDRGRCAQLNALYGDGPGGGALLDSDLGADGT